MTFSFADNLLRQAGEAMRRGDKANASRLVDQLLAAHPRHAAANHMRGALYLQENRAAAALAPLRKAVDGGAGPQALVNLGMALAQTGATNEAEEVLRRAAGLSPENAEFAYNLGHFLSSVGKIAEAEDWLSRATTLAPQAVDPWLKLGSLHYDAGRDDDALACFNAALARQPDHIAGLYNKALVDQRQGRFAEAHTGYERCRERLGPKRGVMLGLAACLQELGRMAEALIVYRTLLAADRGAYAAILRTMTTASKGSFDSRGARLRDLLGLS